MKELTEEQLMEIDHNLIFHSDNRLCRILKEIVGAVKSES